MTIPAKPLFALCCVLSVITAVDAHGWFPTFCGAFAAFWWAFLTFATWRARGR